MGWFKDLFGGNDADDHRRESGDQTRQLQEASDDLTQTTQSLRAMIEIIRQTLNDGETGPTGPSEPEEPEDRNPDVN